MEIYMKRRNGFVSNSSASSFILNKSYLSLHQLKLIRNYQTEAIQMVKDNFKSTEFWSLEDELESLEDSPWKVEETKEKLRLYTWMDNFDMEWFLEQIGIPKKAFLDKENDLHTSDLDDWNKTHYEN